MGLQTILTATQRSHNMMIKLILAATLCALATAESPYERLLRYRGLGFGKTDEETIASFLKFGEQLREEVNPTMARLALSANTYHTAASLYETRANPLDGVPGALASRVVGCAQCRTRANEEEVAFYHKNDSCFGTRCGHKLTMISPAILPPMIQMRRLAAN